MSASLSGNDEQKRDPYSSFRHAGFRRFIFSNFLFNVGRQGLSVAIAWQVYRWTNSATALGLIGLVNVIPLLAFVIPAGVLADRVDRRKIVFRTMTASAVLSFLLVLCTHYHDAIPYFGFLREINEVLHHVALFFERHLDDPSVLDFSNPALPIIFVLQFLHSAVRVIGNPARTAIIPLLVPKRDLGNALTWNSSAYELSSVLGPTMGGLIAAWSFTTVYTMDAVFSAVLAVSLVGVRLTSVATFTHKDGAPAPKALAGVGFIWRQKPVLAAITLDLFAVLLGGVTALLPIYADKILHLSSFGLGWLRAAPSLGAITMAFLITHRAPAKRPGLALLWSVVGFGGSIVVFSLSRNFVLSLVALYMSGLFDNFSVVVRQTLVQMLTPDALRGRVTSVNQLFIGSSNEISELRGGLSAAVLGPVVAATAGGFCTILVVAIVALTLPALRFVPPLHKLKPVEE